MASNFLGELPRPEKRMNVAPANKKASTSWLQIDPDRAPLIAQRKQALETRRGLPKSAYEVGQALSEGYGATFGDAAGGIGDSLTGAAGGIARVGMDVYAGATGQPQSQPQTLSPEEPFVGPPMFDPNGPQLESGLGAGDLSLGSGAINVVPAFNEERARGEMDIANIRAAKAYQAGEGPLTRGAADLLGMNKPAARGPQVASMQDAGGGYTGPGGSWQDTATQMRNARMTREGSPIARERIAMLKSGMGGQGGAGVKDQIGLANLGLNRDKLALEGQKYQLNIQKAMADMNRDRQTQQNTQFSQDITAQQEVRAQSEAAADATDKAMQAMMLPPGVRALVHGAAMNGIPADQAASFIQNQLRGDTELMEMLQAADLDENESAMLQARLQEIAGQLSKRGG